jgi:hypothetical protein
MSIFKTEKDLEDILYQHMVDHEVNPMNGRRLLSVIRQPRFDEYGIPDLITYEADKTGRRFINVIELKNTPFHTAHIHQVSGYMALVKASVKYAETFGVDSDSSATKNLKSGILDMYPGSVVQGSILVVGQDDLSSQNKSITGTLFLCGISVYSLAIKNLSLEFKLLSDGKPCPILSDAAQPELTALSCGLEQ